LLCRKHKDGIKLAGERTDVTAQKELNSSTVTHDLTTKSSRELESDVQQKQKADALWADFLNDVGNVTATTAVSTNTRMYLFEALFRISG